MLYEVRRTPALLERVGSPSPTLRPDRLSVVQVHALRRGLPWTPGTLSLHFTALRRFLRWAGNPLANDAEVWSVPGGVPTHRRWLRSEDLAGLFRESVGPERLLVSLEGFNGLRRIEVLRLRWPDVDLAARRLRVLGKGRNGGKWRVIPMFPATEKELRAARDRAGQPPPEGPVLGLARTGADRLLQRAVNRSGLAQAGVRVSHHDLRRTFGRLANDAGMDLVQLKNLYGHASMDQTVHYIGLDEDRMREGLDRLARLIDPLLNRRRGKRTGAPGSGAGPPELTNDRGRPPPRASTRAAAPDGTTLDEPAGDGSPRGPYRRQGRARPARSRAARSAAPRPE